MGGGGGGIVFVILGKSSTNSSKHCRRSIPLNYIDVESPALYVRASGSSYSHIEH